MSVMQSCARCGGQIGPDATWCSLCLTPVDRFDPLTAPLEAVASAATGAPVAADTRSTPVGAGPVAPPPAAASPAADPEPAPPGVAATAAAEPEPALEPGTRPAAAPAADVDVDTMLVLLAAEHRAHEPLAGLADRMGERSTRAVVIAVGAIGLSVALFAVLSVVALLA